ncbi:MAG: pyridoxal-phosphate dependent enzyme [Chloroflexi bacterium]|nr:pyridoxal-phosphate dependent enzyme [Chloroflexota bacterium]
MTHEEPGFRCENCGLPYPEEGVPHRCPRCGGVFRRARPLTWVPPDPNAKGMWRYRAAFPLPKDVPPVTLGEGATRLLPSEDEPGLWFKLEYENPTGSHKARAASLTFTWLRARGVSAVVDDSSGNAGAAWAAYARAAGIPAHIFVPEGTHPAKQARIRAAGAQLTVVPGPRSAATEAAQQAAQTSSAVYASHAWLPIGLDAYATLAWEIVEQLGQAPGSVFVPVGHGALLVGLAEGFRALLRAGQIARLPALVGVQALACAPIWALARGGPEALLWVTEGETVAEGVRVRQPVWGRHVLDAVQASQGALAAIDEPDILAARDFLHRRGLYVEPTSALVWAAYTRLKTWAPKPAVLVLTGSPREQELWRARISRWWRRWRFRRNA